MQIVVDKPWLGVRIVGSGVGPGGKRTEPPFRVLVLVLRVLVLRFFQSSDDPGDGLLLPTEVQRHVWRGVEEKNDLQLFVCVKCVDQGFGDGVVVEILVLDIDESLGEMNRPEVGFQNTLFAIVVRVIACLREHRVQRTNHLHCRDEFVGIGALQGLRQRGRIGQLVVGVCQVPVDVEDLLKVSDRGAANAHAHIVYRSFRPVPPAPRIVHRMLARIEVLLFEGRAEQQRFAVPVDDQFGVRVLVRAHPQLFHVHRRTVRQLSGVAKPLHDRRIPSEKNHQDTRNRRRPQNGRQDAGDYRDDSSQKNQRGDAENGCPDDREPMPIQRRFR